MHISDTATKPKDRLSKRERTAYKVLHALGLAWAILGFLWFLILNWSVPTYAHAIVFMVGCLPVVIFGYALRTDTRVILCVATVCHE